MIGGPGPAPDFPSDGSRASPTWSDRLDSARRWLAILSAGASAGCAAVVAMGPVLVVLGAVLAATGVAHLGRVRVHEAHREYRRDRLMRALVAAERRLSLVWVASGVGLAAASVLAAGHANISVVTSVLGTAASIAIYTRAISLAADIASLEVELQMPGGSARVAESARVQQWVRRADAAQELPWATRFKNLFGAKRDRGRLSAYVVWTLTPVFMIAATLGVLSIAGAATLVATNPKVRSALGVVEDTRNSKGEPRGTLSYAELCRELPDPLQIGFGIGPLFAHDGAVQAGCGAPPVQLVGGTVIARGMCGRTLRSVAVAVPGRHPVLFYGAAARYAEALAVSAEPILGAERATVYAGEVALVSTVQGSVAFVRAVLAERPGTREARRCQEVDELARAYVVLPPPVTRLWARWMAVNGWAWPERAGHGTWAFRPPAGRAVALATCDEEGGCSLGGDRDWFAAVAPVTSMAALVVRPPVASEGP